jgi:hypothetical protein
MIKVLEWDEMEETEEKLIMANLLWLPWHPSPKSLCFKAATCSAQAHNIIFSVMKLYCQFGGTAEDPKSRILLIVTPPNVQYSPTMLNIATCVSLLEQELSSKRQEHEQARIQYYSPQLWIIAIDSSLSCYNKHFLASGRSRSKQRAQKWALWYSVLCVDIVHFGTPKSRMYHIAWSQNAQYPHLTLNIAICDKKLVANWGRDSALSYQSTRWAMKGWIMGASLHHLIALDSWEEEVKVMWADQDQLRQEWSLWVCTSDLLPPQEGTTLTHL